MMIFSHVSILLFSLSFTQGHLNGPELEWWQTSIFYQVYPRSFKDSDGDGIGDIRGVEEKVDYFKELGVGAVWLSPILMSPMRDFGYDITNYTLIEKSFGTVEDLKSLKNKLSKHGIKLIMDFVPNHTSNESIWFQNSIQRIDPYTDYYVWKDPKGFDNDGKPIAPNNWVSVFNLKSTWTYVEQRKQFYLHHFLPSQPDLNYRSPALRREMEDALLYWIEQGIDGYRIDSVGYLVEDEDFADEVYIDPKRAKNEYYNLHHNHTMNSLETFEILHSWRVLLDDYAKKNNLETRVMLTEVYTDLQSTLRYYGNHTYKISQMPFNFELITKITPQSNSHDLNRTIHSWLDNMPKGAWANWVIGNHDRVRVGSRFGEEMVDAFNMLVNVLPGTAVNYNGDEFGMLDGFIRWDQTVDPQGIIAGKENYLQASRDGCRTPLQWDDSINAGFSTGNTTWLPLNPNYWRINVKEQTNAKKSHLKVYKRLAEARKTQTLRMGEPKIYTPSKWIFILTRKLQGHPTFILVINMGTERVQLDLRHLHIDLPKELHVFVSSVNALHNNGDKINLLNGTIAMRPKSSLLLTTEPHLSTSNSVVATPSLMVVFIINILCLFSLM